MIYITVNLTRLVVERWARGGVSEEGEEREAITVFAFRLTPRRGGHHLLAAPSCCDLLGKSWRFYFVMGAWRFSTTTLRVVYVI